MKRLGLVLAVLILPIDVFASLEMEEERPLEIRLQRENEWRAQGLVLVPHRFNYFLPAAYSANSQNPIFGRAGQGDLDRMEAKFQISIKVLIAQGILRGSGHLYIAYTQLSLWQLYNRGYSSPIRENNYEPELIAAFNVNTDIMGWRLRHIGISMTHQSNGREHPLSRSWNRVIGNFHFDRGNYVLSVKPWYRIPEPRGRSDNSDIAQYMGYGELSLGYLWNGQMISLLARNNLRTEGNRGAVEIDYSFPLSRRLRGLFQYFNGYGESLIDYNHHIQRFGFGFALSDWN